jgi:hypothetical protein
MLLARVRRSRAAGGRSITVTHGLHTLGGVGTLEFYSVVQRNALGGGAAVGNQTYFDRASLALSNRIRVINTRGSQITVDVFCIFWQGRLY